jgi:hypothetical protein
MDPSRRAHPIKQESQAQTAAEADIGGDLTRPGRQRFDRRQDGRAVGAVEHRSQTPTGQPVGPPQLSGEVSEQSVPNGHVLIIVCRGVYRVADRISASLVANPTGSMT